MKMMSKIAFAVLALILCYGFVQAKEDLKYKKAFPYKENYIRNSVDRHGRIRGATVYISPLNEELNFDANQISATCMAAAKYYAEDFSKKYNRPDDTTLIDSILIILTDMPYDIKKYGRNIHYDNIGKIAECHYVLGKSKGLFSYGKPEWQWITVLAGPRNTDAIEKKIESLWIKLHGNFKQGNTIRENDLKKEIAKVLNLNPADITFTPILLNKMDIKNFEDVGAQGPLDNGD